MLKYILILAVLTRQNGFCQCEFGDRYHDSYLNIKKQDQVGDSSFVHILTSGSLSCFILKRKDSKGNYSYDKDIGYKHRVKIRFDGSNRVQMYYYKYNSGFWGSAGHGTGCYSYDANGNIKVLAWVRKNTGQINIYDSVEHEECDISLIPMLQSHDCIRSFNKWYLIPGKMQGEIDGYGFFKRWTFIRKNKERSTRFQMDWKNGFDLDVKTIQE